MAQTDTQVRAAITGKVYRAPVGTSLPTDVTTALNVAFAEVGFIDPDGLTEGLTISKEIKRAWQRMAGIRTLITEINWVWKFKALETSPVVLDLFYNGTTETTAAGVAKTAISASPDDNSYAWVIQVEDGSIITRYVLPKGDVTERAEVAHKGTDLAMYELSVQVLGTSIADLGLRYTNDPAFVTPAS